MLVYGRNSVYEYLINKKVKKLYLLNGFSDKDILSVIGNVSTKYVDKYILEKMVEGNHQGIVAEVEDYKYADIDDMINKEGDCTLIILDHIQDPHNLGAITRTVEAANLDGIIIPKDRSVEVNATVIKTSVGTTENVNISMVTNINNTINYLKDQGFWIVGTAMDGENYTKIDYHGKIAIVIGNEGKGISDIVRKNCDFIASIPMYGTTNSLNASVATGIIIYEVVRQLRS